MVKNTEENNTEEKITEEKAAKEKKKLKGEKVIFFFPGQGAQYSGMGKDLWDESPLVRKRFAEASDLIGRDMATLLFEGTEDELKETVNTQVSVSLMNCAVRDYLRERGIESAGSAGFSLGELSALYDASVLDFAHCIRIAEKRGSIMHRAVQNVHERHGEPGMAAVIGLDFTTVETLLRDQQVQDLFAANDNGPNQVVLSGTSARVKEVMPLLKEAGARRVIPLKVSGPFHTPLLQEAADEFAQYLLQDLPDNVFSAPEKKFYSNYSGKEERDPERIRRFAVEQLISPVRWTEIMRAVREFGETEGLHACYETGPGKVLSGLWRSIGSEIPCIQAGTKDQLDKIQEHSVR